MAGTRSTLIDAQIKAYKKEILKDVEKRCIRFCDILCAASIRYRETAIGKHDFTGNLLNSIVVGLYENRKPIYACYAAGKVPAPIFTKMTAPNRYAYSRDYEGGRSIYKAEIKTDEGWGTDDAKEFFATYVPQGNYLFQIVVAYPTEYAEWVEIQRGTTGIATSYDMASKMGIEYLRLEKAA